VELARIVVATDLSDVAGRALAAAADIARAAGGRIHVVHVAERLLRRAPAGAALRAEERAAEEELDEPLRRRLNDWIAEHIPPDLAIDAVLREGDPASEILALVRDLDAGLLVVGRHGHSALERFFLGSTAQTLTRVAPCAVLVVPPADGDAGAAERD
jgi:nucleotide-binding universal stress UspA family protein